MTPALEEAQRLFRLALRDRGTVELLLPLPQASIAAIGFHAQQSVKSRLNLCASCVAWKFGVPTTWRHWHKAW